MHLEWRGSKQIDAKGVPASMGRRLEIAKGVILGAATLVVFVLQSSTIPDPRHNFSAMLVIDLILMSPGLAITLIAWVATRTVRLRKRDLSSDHGFGRVWRLVALIGLIGTGYGSFIWIRTEILQTALAVAGIFGAAMAIVAIIGLTALIIDGKKANPSPRSARR